MLAVLEVLAISLDQVFLAQVALQAQSLSSRRLDLTAAVTVLTESASHW
jgi:hypothetical protein